MIKRGLPKEITVVLTLVFAKFGFAYILKVAVKSVGGSCNLDLLNLRISAKI